MSKTTARPLMSGWMPTREVLAWCGAALYPVALFGTTRGGNVLMPLGGMVCALLTILVLAMTRRHPWPAFGILLFSWLVIIPLGGDGVASGFIRSLQVLVTDLGVAMLAVERPRGPSIGGAAVAVIGQLCCGLGYMSGSGYDYPSIAGAIVLAAVVAWMTGILVRMRRQHTTALATQATEQAVTAERLAIARELHDMVAHSIGVIAIQAGAGSRVFDTQPDEARNALSTIEDTSRETLSGLRRMLGTLRRAEPEAASQPASVNPTPGLADIQRLVAAAQEAGVRVDIRWLGERRALPSEIDLSAFRIVQEAVTNVVRHAQTDECSVTIDHRDEELTIEIVDDGRGCGTTATGGFGIVGMRERTSLLHGRFAAGPRPEGGFRVHAWLPLPRETR